jgi:glucokinase
MNEAGMPPLRASAVAVDLGGTWLRATTAEHGLDGLVRTRVSVHTTPEALAEQIWALTDALVGGRAREVSELVIAVPTFVAPDGCLLDCPALPHLTGSSLEDEVSRRWVTRASTGPQVRVVPDIAAAVIGEATSGTGRGVDRFLCVAIGTGVNAGAVIDGHLLTTAHGCLGDAGHVVIEIDGLACTCGGRGCLETRASGWALDREAAATGLDGAASLVAAALAGDPRARQILQRAGVALGCAMATWSAMVWPEVIAVAGGVSQAGESLLGPARAALARHSPPYIAGRISVVAAELGSQATLAGCMALADPGGLPVTGPGV